MISKILKDKKRIAIIILALITVLSAAACSTSKNKSADDTNNDTVVTTSTEDDNTAASDIDAQKTSGPEDEPTTSNEASAKKLPVIPEPPEPREITFPQIDSSTARIPITGAIYELFTGTYGRYGLEPLASKTHGAWLNLADKKADILFTVAPTDDELAYFAERGVDIEMKVYGYDGLVFIGNESNPVSNLTTKQIRDIYSGNVDNWSELGGEDAEITVYIRDAESGSQRLFESLVWDGYDMPDFRELQYSKKFRDGDIDPNVTQRSEQFLVNYGMGGITTDVLSNQYSIGFNIMSYIDSEFGNSKLKLFSVNGYAPTTNNFISGKYPYLTTSYVAIRADEPEDSPARELFNWVGSEESRELIAENSTLTVSFGESVIVEAGAWLP